jgi:GTP-binding protein
MSMALKRHVSLRSLSNIRRFSAIVDAPISTTEVLKTLNTYNETTTPNEAQLDYAYNYFTSQVPQFLFGTSKFREFPDSSSPEVTFLGRSNVGKSSLLNALFNRPNDRLAYVSKRPGRTRAMNAFGIGGASIGGAKRIAKPGMSLEMMADDDLKKGSEMRNYIGRGGLVVVDPPGYGHGSREEWGKEVVKYLQARKQYV